MTVASLEILRCCSANFRSRLQSYLMKRFVTLGYTEVLTFRDVHEDIKEDLDTTIYVRIHQTLQ